jgi:hypothetical protein
VLLTKLSILNSDHLRSIFEKGKNAKDVFSDDNEKLEALRTTEDAIRKYPELIPQINDFIDRESLPALKDTKARLESSEAENKKLRSAIVAYEKSASQSYEHSARLGERSSSLNREHAETKQQLAFAQEMSESRDTSLPEAELVDTKGREEDTRLVEVLKTDNEVLMSDIAGAMDLNYDLTNELDDLLDEVEEVSQDNAISNAHLELHYRKILNHLVENFRVQLKQFEEQATGRLQWYIALSEQSLNNEKQQMEDAYQQSLVEIVRYHDKKVRDLKSESQQDVDWCRTTSKDTLNRETPLPANTSQIDSNKDLLETIRSLKRRIWSINEANDAAEMKKRTRDLKHEEVLREKAELLQENEIARRQLKTQLNTQISTNSRLAEDNKALSELIGHQKGIISSMKAANQSPALEQGAQDPLLTATLKENAELLRETETLSRGYGPWKQGLRNIFSSTHAYSEGYSGLLSNPRCRIFAPALKASK